MCTKTSGKLLCEGNLLQKRARKSLGSVCCSSRVVRSDGRPCSEEDNVSMLHIFLRRKESQTAGGERKGLQDYLKTVVQYSIAVEVSKLID